MHFFLFPTGNGLIIREVLLSKELLCKHANNHIQMWPQSIAQFVLHECKSGESMFIFHWTKCTKTILIFVIFIYSLKHWHNNELLIIFIHNFVIGFISNGSEIASFIVSLNMDYCMLRRLSFKGSTTWSSEGFIRFN